MFDALLSLIPGGSVTAIVAAIVAALAGVWRVYAAGKSAGRDAEKVNRNDSYEKHMQDIAGAANARPSRKLSDDPYNRDNQ